MTAAEAATLQREHDALCHTLSYAEELVSDNVMAKLRQKYREAIMAAQEQGR